MSTETVEAEAPFRAARVVDRLGVVVGTHRANEPRLREGVYDLRQIGIEVDVRVMWEADQCAMLVDQLADAGVEAIAAVGGDGTVNMVVNALMGIGESRWERPSVGIVPAGTANDFATMCDIPQDVRAAVALVTATRPIPVDVGRVNGRHFVNMANAGHGAEVTTETSEEVKRLLGGFAYMLTGLTSFSGMTGHPATVRGENFEWHGSLLGLAVGNGRRAGGGFNICPAAILDDGLLDLTVIPDAPFLELVDMARSIVSDRDAEPHPNIVRASSPWFEIDSEQPLQVNLDGEPTRIEHARFDAVAAPIRMHLPRSVAAGTTCAVVGYGDTSG